MKSLDRFLKNSRLWARDREVKLAQVVMITLHRSALCRGCVDWKKKKKKTFSFSWNQAFKYLLISRRREFRKSILCPLWRNSHVGVHRTALMILCRSMFGKPHWGRTLIEPVDVTEYDPPPVCFLENSSRVPDEGGDSRGNYSDQLWLMTLWTPLGLLG